ncbi:MAG: hypothetical protein BWY74_01443 [Firmicutes bacterium ADurb.Bin419]|nr:MAG: hypothetical protein BWY74_01443 [Firmicutes bacterium ADurb.Bin419]
MISNKDRELFKVMNESLKRYLKAASLISQEAFDLLSKHNGLLWSEISDQSDVLEELTKANAVEEVVSEERKEAVERAETVERAVAVEKKEAVERIEVVDKLEVVEKKAIINEKQVIDIKPIFEKETFPEKENITEKAEPVSTEGDEPSKKDDGPVLLYNKVVNFLKNQKCDEMQWVRTYSIRYPYADFTDFQIKYFEHKDPLHESKNYIMFGDTRKYYSIRKAGDEIIGDTSECFNIILNLSHVLKCD